ncbi:hypothetical protein Halru_0322 [Halovivax ruber XH-70]|uniref:DUF7344 domain-containing protein n=1 Tax=Halovivax ruber (strain DSM 18193 / JCM 13892 / XH-70) TaxID=797302 RepID=L0I9P8_HALRX|nr:hypothetical protein [Halovivax ruber]AGB14966.1 hypothetical protein Halru_0322 [Halovivax ruber XH-70]
MGASHGSHGEIFELLSNRRRRYAIHYCKRVDEPVELGDLAEQVAAWELDKEVQELTSAERKRVYTALQQTHLPTLERADVVEFENHTIELTDEADALEIYLDIVPADSIPWGVYYLGLSVLGFVVLAGVWADVVPTETIPPLGWAGLVLGAVTVSAIAHVLTSRRYRLGEMERPP